MRHHRAGLARTLSENATEFMDALERYGRGEGPPPEAATSRERAMLDYAMALTHRPAEMTRTHLQPMREAGLSDAELLDVNQVVSYFAYVNRMVDGLGVELEDDNWP